MEVQALYQKAIAFATIRHMQKSQTVKGTDMPYVVHLSNVAMEVLMAAPHSPGLNLGFAIQVALLHDTIEDTATTEADLSAEFGAQVAESVLALSKNHHLPTAEQMPDCLRRIALLPTEVGTVKLADRITNLQPPPALWDAAKIAAYQQQARDIAAALGHCNPYLHQRLLSQIEAYGQWVK